MIQPFCRSCRYIRTDHITGMCINCREMYKSIELKEFQKVKTPKEKFPDEFTIKQKLYSPLSVLRYNLTFEFDDNYPAKMPKDFARDMITLYSKEDDTVWDGCCGSGIVPRIANKMYRQGWGSDVNKKAISLAQKHDQSHFNNYFISDARDVVSFNSDLILSSLPFGLNIIGDKNNYSNESKDLSNSSDYDSFFIGSKQIIQSYFDNLKPGGVCILDARDRLLRGKTIPLILRFLQQAEEVGFELVTRYYYELIPYRQMTYKHKPSGHIKAMPDTMDVIVLTKLENETLDV